ncbi:MAG: hypothetical protein K2I64_06195 [Muribaculaceae bacterium]|nr:hypothetical protein [Muribaculaceae bacterium]
MATKHARRLLAGTVISADGISRNMIISREQDSRLTMSPFTHEIHSTAFVDCIAFVDTSRITRAIIKEIERISAEEDTPAVQSFLSAQGLLAAPGQGALLAVGTQSIIIEI